MDPQDDPEARIRELERPLADAARELGTADRSDPASLPPAGGASWPPNTSPYHADHYPPAPRRPGVRPWMLAVGIALVGLIVIAGASAVIGTMTGSDVSDGPGEGVLGGGGGIDGTPTGVPSISIPSIAIPALPGVPAGPVDPDELNPPPGAQVNVAGVGGTKTVVCNDSSVSVSGMSNTITVTGHCLALTVSGVKNVITAETADAITASGVENRVTYRTGTPNVQRSGSDNVVEQR